MQFMGCSHRLCCCTHCHRWQLEMAQCDSLCHVNLSVRFAHEECERRMLRGMLRCSPPGKSNENSFFSRKKSFTASTHLYPGLLCKQTHFTRSHFHWRDDNAQVAIGIVLQHRTEWTIVQHRDRLVSIVCMCVSLPVKTRQDNTLHQLVRCGCKWYELLCDHICTKDIRSNLICCAHISNWRILRISQQKCLSLPSPTPKPNRMSHMRSSSCKLLQMDR